MTHTDSLDGFPFKETTDPVSFGRRTYSGLLQVEDEDAAQLLVRVGLVPVVRDLLGRRRHRARGRRLRLQAGGHGHGAGKKEEKTQDLPSIPSKLVLGLPRN